VHRDKHEEVKITYSRGDTYLHHFSQKKRHEQ
jgi:hypothetical protein